jgi:hypothetical protein
MPRVQGMLAAWEIQPDDDCNRNGTAGFGIIALSPPSDPRYKLYMTHLNRQITTEDGTYDICNRTDLPSPNILTSGEVVGTLWPFGGSEVGIQNMHVHIEVIDLDNPALPAFGGGTGTPINPQIEFGLCQSQTLPLP